MSASPKAGARTELTSSRAHHGISAHTGGGHGGILGALSRLLQERLAVGLDGGVDIDRGVRGLRLGDIISVSGCDPREAREGRGRVSTRGNTEGLPADGGCNMRHDGSEVVELEMAHSPHVDTALDLRLART